MRDALRILLLRDLDSFHREVELFPGDALIWQTLPGITNPAGTLALHGAGNLQHFIGAVLGGTGYIRRRDLEFSRREGTRADVMAEVRRARDVVDGVLSRLGDGDLARPFPELVNGLRFRTGDFLLHLSTHLAFHLGQAGYLRRALTGDPASSEAMSNRVLPVSGDG